MCRAHPTWTVHAFLAFFLSCGGLTLHALLRQCERPLAPIALLLSVSESLASSLGGRSYQPLVLAQRSS